MTAASATFSERAAVEHPAIELFRFLGWNHTSLYHETFGASGTEGRITMHQAVLPNRLWAALQRLNPHLSTDALRDAAAEIVRDRSAMLPVDANSEIYRLLRNGVSVQVRGKDGERKAETVRVIDWRDPTANDLLLAHQVWFQGELYRRRADLVGFVNGLPLLLLELKGPGENVKDAFDNNIRSYRSDIPQVFAYNAAIVVSNGMETKVGATFAPYEHFIDWKRAESEDEPPAAGLEVAIRGIGAPERLLDLVENFIAYEKGKGGSSRSSPKTTNSLASTARLQLSIALQRPTAGWAFSGILRALGRASQCSISRKRSCARSPATGRLSSSPIELNSTTKSRRHSPPAAR